VVGVSLTYGLLLNSERADRVLAVIAANAWRDSAAGAAGPGALPWLLAATLLATAVLAASLGPATAARRLRASRTAVGVAGAVTMLYALLHIGLLAHLARLQAAGADPLETTSVGTGAFSGFIGAILLLLLALGLVLGWKRGDLRSWSRRPTGLVLVVGLAVGGAAVWLIDASLDPVRADSLLKQARAFVAAGRPEAGLRLLDEACELAPREPVYFLFRGQAALRAAAASEPKNEARFLETAEATLRAALALAPLDPDHSANLARFWLRRVSSMEDPKEQAEALKRARSEYEVALALRPSSVLFMNELAPVLLQAGELDEAEEVIEKARALDDRYGLTFFNLATIRQTRAAKASSARDLRSFVDWCEQAIASYELALLIDPGLDRATGELERLRAALASVPHRAMTGERLAELYGDNVELHLGLARARLDEGLAERAAEHARLALELGDADQAAAARAVLAEARASAGRERD
jgi:tetratricopeptide (TPR) repeat protein